MIYIHYCQHCSRFHMLNGHKTICPVCGSRLLETQIAFTDFVKLSEAERETFKCTFLSK